MRYLRNIFVVGTVIFALSACSREQSVSGTRISVSFQPNSTTALSSYEILDISTENRQIVEAPISTLDFGLPDPTALSQIDCYAIFVRYPEFPDQSVCKDLNGNVIARPHELVGMASFPNPITFSVIAGEGREFTLVGFDSTLGFCPDINGDFTSIESSLSDPFKLGSTISDALPGSTISISAAFAATNKIDQCSGPQFDDGDFQSFNACPAGAGCVFWYDAAESSTIGFGTGSDVNVWNDKSGQGNHAVQASGTAQPNLVASGINGLPTISFNGTTDFLDTSTTPTTAGTIFVVYKNNTSATAQSIFGSNAAGSTELFVYALNASDEFFTGYEATTNAAVDSANPQSSGNTYLIEYSYQAGSQNYKLFGAPTAGLSSSLAGAPDAGTAIYFGAQNANGSPVSYFTGEIGEVIYYNVDISSTQFESDIVNYLKQKWNIP